MDGVPATLTIPTPGVHTVHLWMREDGLKVDKWLLRKSSSSTGPSGTGPAETGLKPRLMALGASITQGVGDDNGFGYRDHVQTRLGVRVFQCIGAYQDPPTDPTFDVDHEGVPGNKTFEVEARLPTALSRHMPVTNPPGSLALLHAGTNDLTSGLDQTATVDNIVDIINLINAHDPSINVYVALLVPSTLPATDATITSFNAALAARLETVRTTKPNVFTVDMNSAFKANPDWATAYMSDAVHPNDVGYQVMAQAWADHIDANQ